MNRVRSVGDGEIRCLGEEVVAGIGVAVGVTQSPTLRASLSGTFHQRKDVVNQCLQFASLLQLAVLVLRPSVCLSVCLPACLSPPPPLSLSLWLCIKLYVHPS